jgi:sulfotransferase
MTKQFYHLAGLPRSGNTLLSAVLNQNPDIYSSPLSPISDILYDTYKIMYTSENSLRNVENQIRISSLMKDIIHSFYKDVDKPIIFDREKAWGTPVNLKIIKEFINPKPKIIFTVRDIPEIIASLIALDLPKVNQEYQASNFYSLAYQNYDDGLADFIMRPGGDLDKTLLSLASAFVKENEGIFHLIEYKDFLNDPKKTMNGIYNFLELEPYEHNFKNIRKIEIDLDEEIGYSSTLHSIKRTISPSPTKAENILSPYIYKKYSGMEFWRNDSLMKVRGQE